MQCSPSEISVTSLIIHTGGLTGTFFFLFLSPRIKSGERDVKLFVLRVNKFQSTTGAPTTFSVSTYDCSVYRCRSLYSEQWMPDKPISVLVSFVQVQRPFTAKELVCLPRVLSSILKVGYYL